MKKNCDSCNDKSKSWYVNVPVVPVKLIEVLKQPTPPNGFGGQVAQNPVPHPFVQPLPPPPVSPAATKKVTINGNHYVAPPISNDTSCIVLEDDDLSAPGAQPTTPLPTVAKLPQQTSIEPSTNGNKNAAASATAAADNECIVLDDDDEDESQPANNQKELHLQQKSSSTENLRFSNKQKARLLAKVAAQTIEQQIKTTVSDPAAGNGSSIVLDNVVAVSKVPSAVVTQISNQVELTIVSKLSSETSGRRKFSAPIANVSTPKMVEYVVRHDMSANENDDSDLTLAELQERNQGRNEDKPSTTVKAAFACIDLDDDDDDVGADTDDPATSHDHARPPSPNFTDETCENNDLLVAMDTEPTRNFDLKKRNSESKFNTSEYCEQTIAIDNDTVVTTTSPKQSNSDQPSSATTAAAVSMAFDFNEQLLSLCEISMTDQLNEYTVADLPSEEKPNIPIDPATDDTGDGTGPHQCHVCFQSFKRKCKLTTHLRNSEACSAIINETLTDAVNQFTDTRPYECDICQRRFSGLHFIEQHMFRSHSGTSVRRCRFCRKEFPTPKSLRRHTKSHMNKKNQFACDQCDKRLSTMQGLIVHQRLHTGEMPYKCNVCNKSFRVLSSLSIHVRTHTNVRPYKCDICNRSFSQSASMQNHRLTHTGKPYSCELCPKTFSMARLLTLHTASRHSGIEKPYHCDICQKSSWSLSSLRQHMKRHSGKYGLKCLICLKTFCNVDSLEKHSRRKHSGGNVAIQQLQQLTQQYVDGWMTCEVCSVLQPDAASMEAHMEAHRAQADGDEAGAMKFKQEPGDVKPFKCTHCVMVFSLQTNLERHMKLHRRRKLGRPLKTRHCDVCDKSVLMSLKDFNLHRQEHRVEAARKAVTDFDGSTEIDSKPFKCTQCVMIFSQADNLERHMKLHRKTGRPLQTRYCDVCNKSMLMTMKIFNQHQQEHFMEAALKAAVEYDSQCPTEIDLKPFKCTQCVMVFSSSANLDRHMALHKKKGRPLSMRHCAVCNVSQLWSLKSFTIHQQSHNMDGSGAGSSGYSLVNAGTASSAKPFKCKTCGRSFAERTQLDSHEYATHAAKTADNRYKCSKCHKSMSSAYQLREHMHRHSGEKPYLCKHCDKRFAQNLSMYLHIRRHHPGVRQEFRCDLCDKSYARHISLLNHRKMHETAGYQCKYCDTELPTQEEMITHFQMHLGDRPYLCVHCNERFAQRHELKSHSYMHSDVLPIQCDRCTKMFANEGALANHMKLHERRPTFECTQCNKQFSTKVGYENHMVRHSRRKRQFKCDLCPKMFWTKLSLNAHRRRHDADDVPVREKLECPVCRKTFMRPHTFENHLRKHAP